MKKIRELAIIILLIIIIGLFLSYKLTKIPPGINIDESSIGYNAALVSRTLKDENNRLLPVFVLTLGGKDWKQPVRIYATALLFKIFGPSYFGLRFISVICVLISGFIFYFILRLFFSISVALIGFFLYLSSPSLLLQSHLALENVDLLPFVLLWLYFLLSYSLKPKNSKLVFSGIFLGVSFYAYKGMRTVVPVYLILSVLYLFYLSFFKKVGQKKSFIYFMAGSGLFLWPIKILQTKYAGAIYDPAGVGLPSFFQASLVYLSSFDFSFLFLKGDKMLVHSTGRDGLFLLPTLILFFLGFTRIAKENKNQFYLILFCLIVTPLLLTTVNSIYRASRLMVFVPFFSFIFVLGFKSIVEINNKILKLLATGMIAILLIINYVDFAKNYFAEYPKLISGDFSPDFDHSFFQLKKLSSEKRLDAYIEYNDLNNHRADIEFFREVYFNESDLKVWAREVESFPENGLILTSISASGELENIMSIPSLQKGQKTFYVVKKID